MKYVKIKWDHPKFIEEDSPYLYLLALDRDNFETRKIEKYYDGKVYFASNYIEYGTFLSPIKFEGLKFYILDDEKVGKMFVEYIDKKEFEQEWEKIDFQNTVDNHMGV